MKNQYQKSGTAAAFGTAAVPFLFWLGGKGAEQAGCYGGSNELRYGCHRQPIIKIRCALQHGRPTMGAADAGVWARTPRRDVPMRTEGGVAKVGKIREGQDPPLRPRLGTGNWDGKRATAEAVALSLPKKYFSAGWQRSRKPQRQANRTRRRTGGTVEGGLRSKSKCLAQQAF